MEKASVATTACCNLEVCVGLLLLALESAISIRSGISVLQFFETSDWRTSQSSHGHEVSKFLHPHLPIG